MADRLGQVAADRVIPIGNHTIIGGFSLAVFALRTGDPTPQTRSRVPKHVRYQATLLPVDSYSGPAFAAAYRAP
jgi:hypothetical protein